MFEKEKKKEKNKTYEKGLLEIGSLKALSKQQIEEKTKKQRKRFSNRGQLHILKKKETSQRKKNRCLFENMKRTSKMKKSKPQE